MKRLTRDGCGIIFISHKLDEVTAVSDRVTVLRSGRVAGSLPTSEATASSLSALMLERSAALGSRTATRSSPGPPVLEIENVACLNDRGGPALRGISLVVRQGEIVGVAGVDGNGQGELAECVAGLRRITAGRIRLAGIEVTGVVSDPSRLGFIHHDRQHTALVQTLSIADNLVLKTFANAPFSRFGLLNRRAILAHATQLIDRFGIRAAGPESPVRDLSGGNQQRVVIARETERRPACLLAVQPTRGLDVGATESVHRLLRDHRDSGAAILYVSTELSELMTVSDRLVVLTRGELMGELAPDPAQLDIIGEMMLGRWQRDRTA
jgi:simple sugar transport system ATP-binding protein